MSEHPPVLHVDEPDGRVTAVALVLHGGQSTSHRPTRATQLAVLRLVPFARSLHAAGSGHGLAVARLRYRERGWNGAEQSPVPDVFWALEDLQQRFPGTPAALVGHSMGGRAAVYAGGQDSVRTVVGLAPWIEPGDPYEQLAGRRILFAHGDADHMTSPVESTRYAARAATVAGSVSYVAIAKEHHPMLRRPRLWHELATGFVLATLCGVPPEGTVGEDTANILTKALAGAAHLAA